MSQASSRGQTREGQSAGHRVRRRDNELHILRNAGNLDRLRAAEDRDDLQVWAAREESCHDVDFPLADVDRTSEGVPVEVLGLKPLRIHDDEPPHARGSQNRADRRAHAARADDEYARPLKPALAGRTQGADLCGEALEIDGIRVGGLRIHCGPPSQITSASTTASARVLGGGR